MPPTFEDFMVIARFFESGKGWGKREYPYYGDYIGAGQYASKIAQEMDVIFPNDTSWTVDLYGVNGAYPNSSYYQFFHGRTS